MRKIETLVILSLLALIFSAVAVNAGGFLTPASAGAVTGTTQNVTVNLTNLVSNLTQTSVTLVAARVTPAGTDVFLQSKTNTTANQRHFEFSFDTAGNFTLDANITINATANFTNGTFIESFQQGNVVNNTALTFTQLYPQAGNESTDLTPSYGCSSSDQLSKVYLKLGAVKYAMTGNATLTGWTYQFTTDVPQGNYQWACLGAADAETTDQSSVYRNVQYTSSTSGVSPEFAAAGQEQLDQQAAEASGASKGSPYAIIIGLALLWMLFGQKKGNKP